MQIELITSNADPDHGGFGARVYGVLSMFARFADVRVVQTDDLGGSKVPGVSYEQIPLEDGPLTRLQRLGSYYRTRFPRRRSVEPPDFVVVESLDLIGLHQYGPDVPIVLDEHNVWWNLLQYQIADTPFFRGWLGRRAALRRWIIPMLLDRARRFEIQAIRESRRTLVTSSVDCGVILAEAPDLAGKVRVLPNCVDVQRLPAFLQDEKSRNVVFVGDLNYKPNRDAAKFVTDVLAPGIPDAQFLLVGRRPASFANGGPNVKATGRVPDLKPTLREAAVCIAPLKDGSGTRLKILTYLAAARAVVATTKACEGLSVEDEVHLLIRDDPAEFRAAVEELLEDPARRLSLGEEGRALVESAFDWRVHVPWLRTLSEEVLSGTVS